MGLKHLFQLRFRSANARTRQVALALVASALGAVLWLGMNQAVATVKTSWNERQLSELVQNVILRGEFAIDNVILAEVDLIASGYNACNPATMSAMRAAIYRHSALVDIHLRTPQGNCQAFAEFGLDQDAILAAKEGALAARNADFTFMRLADQASSGLGVVWEFQQGSLMTAVVRTDGLLFDMLPAAIRDHASIVLSLDDGGIVASYEAPRAADHASIGGTDTLAFSASSQRYPLLAQIAVPPEVFTAWRAQSSPLLLMAMALSAAVLGFLIALGVVRAPSERERLQTGLQSGEIAPYFQPIVCLRTGKVVGCEVLARWNKADGTQVSPGMFIPLAELTGLSDDITRTLMRQTGRDLGEAIAHRPSFKINFNITVKQLDQPGFADDLLAHAKVCGLPKSQLIVELIEREALDSVDGAYAALAQLQAEGVRVAIDDVGTGQNGLALLQSLDADIVKIDKLFVDMIHHDESSRVISEMLVRLAKTSDMCLVAEGVEHKEQAETLLHMGIEQAQGYYFARPMPADGFLTFLAAENSKELQSTLAANHTKPLRAA